jgi:2-succinyl-5-enolpyruvyl-6-hydroxy-3-cyclohexene-1-carboxylate synthase
VVTGDRPSFPGPTPAGPLRAIVEELLRAGVRDVVVCPGSRSTPLALALAADPAIRTWLHLDERAGGFFALGLAKASRRPVGILTTSGTAAVNLHPAVVEALEGRVPLVLLTADRPPELRDRGAPQAIDQDHLFGRHAKWYAELPVPEDELLPVAHLRGVVGRAIAVAIEAPSGPVQLNLPFREPLIPAGDLRPATDPRPGQGSATAQATAPAVRLVPAERLPSDDDLIALAARLEIAARGLIVCGPLDRPGFAPAVAALAAVTGFPILADGLANVRTGVHDRSHVVVRHDTVLRSDSFRAGHRPDVVVRFGGTPTSKALLTWLADLDADQLVVDDGGWNEPTVRPLTMIHADPVRLAEVLAARLSAPTPTPTPPPTPRRAADAGWLDGWLAADRAADRALRAWLGDQGEPFEGAAIAEAAAGLPDGAVLYVGNSMPVRDLDGYLPGSDAAIRCLGNRGANGIDGVVSSALGAAAAEAGPVVLVVGDVSFLHDLNALLAARLHRLSATIVLVNNDGGGIFSFLPQATAERPEVGLPERYEELFGTPHGVDVGPIVTALGGEHRRVGVGELAAAVAASVGRPGVRVLEIRTDRARNVELHRAAVAAAVVALETAIAAPVPGRPRP